MSPLVKRVISVAAFVIGLIIIILLFFELRSFNRNSILLANKISAAITPPELEAAEWYQRWLNGVAGWTDYWLSVNYSKLNKSTAEKLVSSAISEVLWYGDFEGRRADNQKANAAGNQTGALSNFKNYAGYGLSHSPSYTLPSGFLQAPVSGVFVYLNDTVPPQTAWQILQLDGSSWIDSERRGLLFRNFSRVQADVLDLFSEHPGITSKVPNLFKK
jgi:hypothetical protein